MKTLILALLVAVPALALDVGDWSPELRTDGRTLTAGASIAWDWRSPRRPVTTIAQRDAERAAQIAAGPTAFRTYLTPRRIMGQEIAADEGAADAPAVVAQVTVPATNTENAVVAHLKRNAGKYIASAATALGAGTVYYIAQRKANHDGDSRENTGNHQPVNSPTIEANNSGAGSIIINVNAPAAAEATP